MNFSVSTEPADGLAPCGAKISAWKMIAKFGFEYFYEIGT